MHPGDSPSAILAFLRQNPGWHQAVGELRAFNAIGGSTAADNAATYAARYAGERSAMIFDVVASRRHSYRSYVLPNVARFRQQWPRLSLEQLAGGGRSGLGLSTDRWQTVESVAAAFVDYRATDPHLANATDDDLVLDWANLVEPVRAAPKLDCYCGTVKGIGVALFAYLRMHSGADALKPDGRIRARLADLGFPTPLGEHGLLMVAEAAAEELGVTRLHLDQLLW